MKLYGGIDLHSNNSYVVLIDDRGTVTMRSRVGNEIGRVLQTLQPYREQIDSLVVESTYNWYWLVDGLKAAGYAVKLAHPSAMEPYQGLKYSDDRSDARWLAEMLRLGIVPTGYIYPEAQRPLRDLLRQRSFLVRQNTAQLLHTGNILSRNQGPKTSRQQLREMTVAEVRQLFPDRERTLAVTSSLRVIEVLEQQIASIEKQVLGRIKPEAGFRNLQTVYGVGPILAMTIWLETGDIRRFAQVGDYASYCRCVASTRISNAKKKGENNRHNGNPYLAWAYVEAATYAARFYREAARFVERKTAQVNRTLAIKALAHKLARACYYLLRDQVPFEPARLFGS
jgi:transposase